MRFIGNRFSSEGCDLMCCGRTLEGLSGLVVYTFEGHL